MSIGINNVSGYLPNQKFENTAMQTNPIAANAPANSGTLLNKELDMLAIHGRYIAARGNNNPNFKNTAIQTGIQDAGSNTANAESLEEEDLVESTENQVQ